MTGLMPEPSGSHLNVEIKARCLYPERVRRALEEREAEFRGLDRQVDTYFRVPCGRLKLREGNIECNLIYYSRTDEAGPKDSHVTLYHTEHPAALKEILTNALGVLVVVEKEREIYFIDNVKFHVDTIEPLGSFVEIEAIDATGTFGRDHLLRQCAEYMAVLGIRQDDLISVSYSDMLMSAEQPHVGSSL